MTSRNRLLASLFTLTLLTVLAGCGSPNQIAKPPVGNFTNANLSGTYAFAFTGSNAGGFFTMAGSLQADGNGNITTGTAEINSPGLGSLLTSVPLTGTYSVAADGRAAATFVTSAQNFNVDFVLLSNQHGLIIRFDQNATASGTIDQQVSSAFNLPSLAGTFAFDISGVDAARNVEAAGGLFTTDNAGNISSGVVDDNDNGSLSLNTAVTAGAAFSTPAANGRGTLTVTANGVTRSFIYYIVDGNHLKVIEADNVSALAGDLFRQQSAAISGSFVFTQSGTSTQGAFAEGMVLNTDGAGNVVNTSVEDANGITSGFSQGNSVSGVYSLTGGRAVFSISVSGGIAGGARNLIAYPSTGGVLVLDADTTIVATGTAIQQTGTFSNASLNGRFGLNLTGQLVNSGPFDLISQFTADGNGNIKGTTDLNNVGQLSPNLALTGTYSFTSIGRASGSLTTGAGTQHIVLYAASSSQVVFIELDNGQIAVGVLSQQQ